jgi:hypothetical protein
LAIMPTLDDVDIAPVQRGDQSRDVVILRLNGPGGAAGGHGRGGGPPAGHGGVPIGGGPVGSRSGAPVGGRGGAAGDSSTAPSPSNGKQTHVILDDNEVSSDEDEPLQKRLRELSDAGPTVVNEVAAANKEVAENRATKEATVKRAAEEVAAKAAATEEVAGKTADEATGAA